MCAWQRGGRSSRGLCSTGRRRPLCTQEWPAVRALAPEVGRGDAPPPEATGHDSGHTGEAPMILGHAAWQWVGWGGRAPWGAGIHPHSPGPAGGQSTVGQDQREEREERSQVGRGGGGSSIQESQSILVFWSWKTSGSKATPVNLYIEAATPGPQTMTSSGNRVSAGSVNHYLRGSHAGVGWVPNPVTGIPMKRDKLVGCRPTGREDSHLQAKEEAWNRPCPHGLRGTKPAESHHKCGLLAPGTGTISC